jgi:hypothetical protein
MREARWYQYFSPNTILMEINEVTKVKPEDSSGPENKKSSL